MGLTQTSRWTETVKNHFLANEDIPWQNWAMCRDFLKH